MEWYQLKTPAQVDSPALLVYKDRIGENIGLVKNMIDDVQRLRIHVKTHKIAEVAQMMQAAGIQKYKCATIAEAEMLGMVKAKDVLLAYQPVGPKAARLLELVQQYPDTDFACLTDNKTAAEAISSLFAAAGKRLKVYLDLNVGMNRTGIKPEGALDLYRYLYTLPGIQPVGIHAYDGHLHDTDMATRKKRCDEAYGPVPVLQHAIVACGLPEPVIVAGGSPTFPIHAARPVIECSPGTFVFWDWGYGKNLPEQPFQWAALVLSRVVSVIDDQLLCLDLGHKSVAAESPQPRVHFINAPEAQPVSQSEEHLVLKVADTAAYPVGTEFYGVPLHICPTVALYERAYVVEDHVCTGTWKVIARDRMIEH
ncbi:D-serine deaminase, pyridoxal phosphate-dependent [Chitinophaga eiseniae]|uniref:D-serine deaminase, pyridoxal phosphate-dependent n=1 Tax=Chitinophaga eiseniae TaxID=634771 RepID=A0A1T4QD71_9BACT|nr:D-TA family PLP-dependent enzyme [Chitinophaga eiseniae]SKA01699.1 D-serine deaminase, pyridoxal phosphate-dependent [Chitinophaga eiseniae]